MISKEIRIVAFNNYPYDTKDNIDSFIPLQAPQSGTWRTLMPNLIDKDCKRSKPKGLVNKYANRSWVWIRIAMISFDSTHSLTK